MSIGIGEVELHVETVGLRGETRGIREGLGSVKGDGGVGD